MATDETIFHKIIRKEIPAQIVFEDDEVLGFRDTNPISETHVLVIPKKTIPSLREAGSEDALLLGRMLLAVQKIAEQEGLTQNGYRVVINCGVQGGQTVYQLHMHLIGGRAFGWPPG